jgi:hypothetical protein
MTFGDDSSMEIPLTIKMATKFTMHIITIVKNSVDRTSIK